MKNTAEKMDKQEMRTFNYPKDSHKEFCKRCMAYNKACPMTNTKPPSKICAL